LGPGEGKNLGSLDLKGEDMTFLELAQKVIKEEQKPLSDYEIWEIAQAKGYDVLVGSKGKTPWRSIAAQIYVSIRDDKNSPFIKAASKPTRFFLCNLQTALGMKVANSITDAEPPLKPTKADFSERDLHPFLAYYSYHFLKAYTKTIRHSTSGKKEFGEWTHPDMVGCYFPVEDWKQEVVEFSSAIGSIAIKLYSFEIKKELNFSNLRESFFQTVSNSSWSHQAYLAASIISDDEDFLSELRRLSTSFGIGIIQININKPSATEIIFPAKEKEYLDWDAVNKLAMNADFKELLKRLRIDISSQEVRKEKYDKVLTEHDLTDFINKEST
jgi:uncharacterized protein